LAGVPDGAPGGETMNSVGNVMMKGMTSVLLTLPDATQTS